LLIQFRVSKFKTMSLTFTVTLNCAIKGRSTLPTKTLYLLYIIATCFGYRA
jgi:cephalosporin-C deacetylase-like acetyl esterase